MKPLRESTVTLVQSLDDALALKRWLGERHGSETLSFDCETSGLVLHQDHLRLVQLADCDTSWAIPSEDWLGVVKEIFRDWEGHWVGHNTFFDTRFLERDGVEIPRGRLHDTMIAAHVDDPTTMHGLKYLGTKHIDIHATTGQEALKEGMAAQGWTWGTVPVTFTPYWAYGGLDTILTARLHEHYAPVRATFHDVYEMEMAVAQILSDMHVRGMRVDVEYTQRKQDELDQYIDAVYAWIGEHYGIKPGSNDAVANRLLADGVRLEKLTDKGKWSVDSDVLEGLTHPLAEVVLLHRNAVKIRSSYFRGILSRLDGELIHPDIRGLGARTGRMSVANPPFQQLPAEGDGGKGMYVRRCIIPREGNKLVLCDLDQIEFRLLGHFAGEPFVRNAVLAGDDLHWAAARVMYGPDATKAHRKKTKNGTFAVLYGAGKDKLAAQQGVTVPEAEAFIAHYKATFPGITNFVASVEQVAKDRLASTGKAFVMSPLGRRHPMDRDKLYTGVNYLCQGTAADLFKQALVRMDAAGVGPYLTLPVHDEIQADVPADLAEDVARTIQECMTDHHSFSVPVDAKAQIVDNWGEPYEAGK